MRHCHRLLRVALLATLVLVAAASSYGQSPGPPTRTQLDSELGRAGGVSELLQVANRYADGGYQQEAKSIVDRAAQKARSPADWQSISAVYLRLGYSDRANAAQRKAREVPGR